MDPSDQRQDGLSDLIERAYRDLLAGKRTIGSSSLDCEPPATSPPSGSHRTVSAADLQNALSFLQSASDAYAQAVSYTELLLKFCEDLTSKFEDEIAQKEEWKRRALECEDHAMRLIEQITLRGSTEALGDQAPFDPIRRENSAGLRLG